jgi:hypothetical protein
MASPVAGTTVAAVSGTFLRLYGGGGDGGRGDDLR